jgi:hypothetical protein
VRVSGCGRSQRSKDREANASENHAGKNYRDVRANARDSVGMIAVGGGVVSLDICRAALRNWPSPSKWKSRTPMRTRDPTAVLLLPDQWSTSLT